MWENSGKAILSLFYIVLNINYTEKWKKSNNLEELIKMWNWWIMFLLRSVGNGKCLGDSVWASIRCGTDQDVGCVHAEIMGHLVHHCPYFVTSLYLVTSHLEARWTDGWDLRCCWSVLCFTSNHSISYNNSLTFTPTIQKNIQ